MTTRQKRWWIVAMAATGVLAGLGVGRTWFRGRAFDSTAWRDDARVGEGVRLEMADRLIARGALIGKTRGEVIELLGQPTPTGKFADWHLVYWLGPERGFIRIDSEWLVLELDANGRVAAVRMVRD